MKIPAPPLRKARIEIIPMIDTIFFLLVFFMYTSLSMVRMEGLGVSLPKDSQAAPAAGSSANPSTLITTVTDNGDYYVNNTKVTPDTLAATLQAAVRANPKAVVVVNVAKNQNTQTLIDVMDATNKVVTPSGQPIPVMIATEKVDVNTGKGAPVRAER